MQLNNLVCLGLPTRKSLGFQMAARNLRPMEMRVLGRIATPHRRAATSVCKGVTTQLFSTKKSPAPFMGMLYSCILGGRRSVTAWRSVAAASRC